MVRHRPPATDHALGESTELPASRRSWEHGVEERFLLSLPLNEPPMDSEIQLPSDDEDGPDLALWAAAAAVLECPLAESIVARDVASRQCCHRDCKQFFEAPEAVNMRNRLKEGNYDEQQQILTQFVVAHKALDGWTTAAAAATERTRIQWRLGEHIVCFRGLALCLGI